jgi:DNA-binding HxlR family transcriptional regulator
VVQGLVARDPAAGPTARWRLTPAGRSLRPLLQQLYDWGDAQAVRLGVTILGRAGDTIAG